MVKIQWDFILINAGTFGYFRGKSCVYFCFGLSDFHSQKGGSYSDDHGAMKNDRKKRGKRIFFSWWIVSTSPTELGNPYWVAMPPVAGEKFSMGISNTCMTF